MIAALPFPVWAGPRAQLLMSSRGKGSVRPRLGHSAHSGCQVVRQKFVPERKGPGTENGFRVSWEKDQFKFREGKPESITKVLINLANNLEACQGIPGRNRLKTIKSIIYEMFTGAFFARHFKFFETQKTHDFRQARLPPRGAERLDELN